jgi:hypothetical protein
MTAPPDDGTLLFGQSHLHHLGMLNGLLRVQSTMQLIAHQSRFVKEIAQ